MNSAALMLWGFTVTWPGVFTLLGIGCAMLLSMGLWTLRGHGAGGLGIFFLSALLLGLALGRLAHWYCHPLQYPSLAGAMTDYLRGGFSLWGAFAGVILSALLCWGAGLVPELGELGDLLAPGAALGIAVGRLGSFFDLSDRGKFLVETPAFRRLPFGVWTALSADRGEWRFATFFLQSLLCLALAVGLLALVLRRKKGEEEGCVCALFALFYGAGQILLDSTRYDADFFAFNGFIHVPQLLSALAAALAVAFLGGRAIRREGFRPVHAALFAAAFVSMALCGVLEYLVQRYAERYALCYGAMALLLVLLCAVGVVFSVWKPREKASEPLISGNMHGNKA